MLTFMPTPPSTFLTSSALAWAFPSSCCHGRSTQPCPGFIMTWCLHFSLLSLHMPGNSHHRDLSEQVHCPQMCALRRVCRPSWSPGRRAPWAAEASLSLLLPLRHQVAGAGRECLLCARPYAAQRKHPGSSSVLPSGSLCPLKGEKEPRCPCAQCHSQLLRPAPPQPHGSFPCGARWVPAAVTPTPANVSKVELNGRTRPAQRREGKGGQPDPRRHRPGRLRRPAGGISTFIYLFPYQWVFFPCWSVPSSNSQEVTKTDFSGLMYSIETRFMQPLQNIEQRMTVPELSAVWISGCVNILIILRTAVVRDTYERCGICTPAV
uniref:carbonic anhydrase 5A, mitochondrial isoform X2 n=1 Tax=Callithrix jacchus TaxID=9483 RepID=UPI0023DD4458|nr:carbonic anhydrase 5A, mitochondrial isoform X2 [Callithrix jacchus]